MVGLLRYFCCGLLSGAQMNGSIGPKAALDRIVHDRSNLAALSEKMCPEDQNINDRQLIFGITMNPVGVNGIDPVRQGINPFRDS